MCSRIHAHQTLEMASRIVVAEQVNEGGFSFLKEYCTNIFFLKVNKTHVLRS